MNKTCLFAAQVPRTSAQSLMMTMTTQLAILVALSRIAVQLVTQNDHVWKSVPEIPSRLLALAGLVVKWV